MARIEVLPKNIADLIAAGEVVERPSSVIKEFVENSIDAGASNITIEIQNGGKTYMRVTDDGCGIHRDDVKKAFFSHATSKIKGLSDLDSISTLGFRGEALASVCAVSKVDLITSTADDTIGTHYIIEGGEEVLIDDIGAPVGTTIVVRDIFYNIPARLKFLKKDVQEGNYIASILERIALSNPGISFKFIRDGKIVFRTPGDNDLKSAVYAVFGKEYTSQLLSVDDGHEGIRVSGFITKPTAGRGNRTMQIFFVNGRYVKNVIFMSALEQAYKNSIMVGKYPGCILFIEMPYESVDVNVHPAKTEVRFYDERRVFEAIYSSALASISADNSLPQATFNVASAFVNPTEKADQLSFSSVNINQTPDSDNTSFVIKEFGKSSVEQTNVLRSPSDGEKVFDFLSDDFKKPDINVVKTSVQVNSTSSSDNIDLKSTCVGNASHSACVIETENNISYKFLGEAFNTYLIAELENKIIFIDKHAAHERILFNKFKNEGVGESQMMLTPVVVSLSTDEYSAVLENLELLNKAGYEIDDFGDRCVKLSACPPQLVDENLSEIIIEIAGYLAKNIKTLMPEILDWIYHSMACRAAVKAGNFTSRYEAERFIGVVLSDENVRYCPHGRPVLIEMSKYELEKQFGRLG